MQFDHTAGSIYNGLNNRIWIGNDMNLIQKMVEHSFNSIQSTPPKSMQAINASQIFSLSKPFSLSHLAQQFSIPNAGIRSAREGIISLYLIC